jgi:chemotaxis protein MotB
MPKLNLPEGPPAPAVIRPRPAPSRKRGGAWKVAYADFVTAMMALFIVLWMMNATSSVKQSVVGYFKDPRGYTRTLGAGPGHAGEGLVVQRDNIGDLRDQLHQALERVPEFQRLRDNVKFSVTGEGLRIDLLETEQGLFFVSGSPLPTGAGETLLKALATELGTMPNRLVIEGHTDSRPFRQATPQSGYSNWELAADRANAARRLLHAYGIQPAQIAEVRGFADQHPFNEKDSEDARNRRVSVVVRFAQ